MTKVAFVYPDIRAFVHNYPGSYYNGIASMSAYLKQAGHETALVHVCDADIPRDRFIDRVDEINPGLVAFSSTTHTFPLVVKMAAWLAEARPDLPTIAGGVHAILNPNEVLVTPGIDLVCLGEGEQVIVDVCDALSEGGGFAHITGLGWHDGDSVRLNQPCRRVDNLDDLPFPDRSLFDYPGLFDEREGIAMMMASRGCPYSCTYCCNQALREAMGNQKPLIRFHSVDYVIREAKQILDRYDFIKEIHFDDDILFLKETWAEDFTQRFPREIGLPFVSNLRPNLATDKMVSLLAQAGCIEVRIGLESGNDTIRNEVLGRKITREQIIDAIALCHRYGMRVMTFNIVGLPFETPHTVLDTIRLNAEACSDEMSHTIFCPFPRTRLYDISEENGFLTDRRTAYDFFTEAVIEQPTISRRQVEMFRRWFPQLVRLFRVAGSLPGDFGRFVSSAMSAFLASAPGNFLADMVLRVVHPLYFALKRSLLKISGKPMPREDAALPALNKGQPK